MNKNKTYKFYNYFNNGDVFFSRIIMKPFLENEFIEFYHKETLGLFRDLPNVKEFNFHNQDFDIAKNEVFSDFDKPINCWVAQDILERQSPYQNSPYPGCNFENYVGIATELMDLFEIPRYESIEDFLPTISPENLPTKSVIDEIMNEQSLKYDKIMLFCNGNVRSGQSDNFDFTPTIIHLSEENPNILFLTTEEIEVSDRPNIISTSKITNIKPDLIEISYISTLCDVIVGRASGPYTFAQNKDNLLNPNKKFVCFGNNPYISKFYQNAKCEVLWNNSYDFNSQLNLINKSLGK